MDCNRKLKLIRLEGNFFKNILDFGVILLEKFNLGFEALDWESTVQ